jgi:hypothetical protein
MSGEWMPVPPVCPPVSAPDCKPALLAFMNKKLVVIRPGIVNPVDSRLSPLMLQCCQLQLCSDLSNIEVIGHLEITYVRCDGSALCVHPTGLSLL